MKKHARKSFLVPILALASVVAIVTGCYLAQSFSAYAEEETNFQFVEHEIPVANETLTANIHLSTGDIFTGSISNTGEGGP